MRLGVGRREMISTAGSTARDIAVLKPFLLIKKGVKLHASRSSKNAVLLSRMLMAEEGAIGLCRVASQLAFVGRWECAGRGLGGTPLLRRPPNRTRGQ